MLRGEHWKMSKTKVIVAVLVLIVIAGGYYLYSKKNSPTEKETILEIRPERGNISVTFATTGVVEPQNRLEIKPPISGRIEEILVQEGDRVKVGQILAWMSSTDRAALLDSARAQGEEALSYWKEVYKPTPLISPIDGEVIVRAMEPGQTVSTSDVILVLSDRLIVKAQFDETDIGRVRRGQKAVITLDAYPDVKIDGIVNHIAYESKIVNNVTTYDVDIIPRNVPAFFRSGMSTAVEIIEKSKQGVLLIPVGALVQEKEKTFVMVKDNEQKGVSKREVETGLSDGTNVEIISGLTPDDVVVMKQKAYVPPQRSNNGSPFMFGGSRKKKNDRAQ